MNISAVTIAYNDEATIRGTLACLKEHVSQHVVVIAELPFYGEPTIPDNTEKICNEFNVQVVKGTWSDEHLMRTLGNKLCYEADWILTFDSDEMMTSDDIKKLIDFLSNTDSDVIVARSRVYWKDIDHIIVPYPDHMPVIACRPYVTFPVKRNADRPFIVLPEDVVHHHLSWCEPKDIYKKVTNYTHANEFDGHSWYRDYYKDWKHGDDIIMPTGSMIYNTQYSPLPSELRGYLNERVGQEERV